MTTVRERIRTHTRRAVIGAAALFVQQINDDRAVYARARLTVTAGFERGTGLFVNIVPPENAATALRELAAP